MTPGARTGTAGEALAEARGVLATLDHPGLDASVLLARTLDLPRTALIARPEIPIDPAAKRRFGELVGRRAAGEPLAWLTGRREFWSFELEVDRSTLVPRPETERLVEAVLEAVGEAVSGDEGGRVADLGTGCGAVAIAVAREAAGQPEVVATDIDAGALEVARRNVRRLAPGRVELRRGSWCEPLEAGAYAVIASNPPYLRADDPHLLGDGVRHEPRRALVGGRDGLAAIRAIGHGAVRCLRPGGRLLLEHGAEQGAAARAALAAAGFERVRTLRDLGGRDRVTQGTRP
ncbi:MAG: peptide chain release factor N(5)-glutamine methyltransferase [Immundisolibacterales bacterium]|nr:peptide chain release factor N(5)-glutamine methyltransferase [Immundisolibacterales bacterium]